MTVAAAWSFEGHPIHRMTEFLNGGDFLDLGRRVVGEPGIVKAEAHATNYGPGHFLTRHLDNGEDGARRAPAHGLEPEGA